MKLLFLLYKPNVTESGICKHDKLIIWGFGGIFTEFPNFFKNGILKVSQDA